MPYEPPYTLTNKILSLVAEISSWVGREGNKLSHGMDLRLRRVNQIKTIRGSLAIEGNTLSEQQITAILNGKPVIAPVREVQEARNALRVYELVEHLDPLSEGDLFKAHQVLMMGLIDDMGAYRHSGVGVMSGKDVVHMAPPAGRVPVLMKDLLDWLAACDAHPLIASSVFHYEFEFIHPFSDGNGRMGRLWQSILLGSWQSFFYYLPVESIVHQYQEDYYSAIQASNKASDSATFITFMLEMILETLSTLDQSALINASISASINGGDLSTPDAILLLLTQNPKSTRQELAEKIGKDLRTIGRAITKLKESDQLRRIGSNKTGRWLVISEKSEIEPF